MRISRVRVQGFRCLHDVDIAFDDVTTMIGPNGVGKSSVLRALDWFFNGASSGGVTDTDLSPSAPGGRIRVEVEFCDLTQADREQLGRYAPQGSEKVLLWKTWLDGAEVFSGNARAYSPFQEVRRAPNATEKRDLYNTLRKADAALDLPAATSAAQVDDALLQWEKEHPDQLADAEEASTTKFFGFLGGAKLSGLFDYVFVSADLRATEESEDTRNATVGRLLERTIDRGEVSRQVDDLMKELNEKQDALVSEHLVEQLTTLASELTAVVSEFTVGREMTLDVLPAAVKVAPLQIVAGVMDGPVHTPVAGQGHGFQRALLIAALRMVAERGKQDKGSGTILLAIEEPELYQHPAQARSFAATLRRLAEDAGQAVQVVYATHSPLFIEPGEFHQLRRFRRDVSDGQRRTSVVAASRAQVVQSLEGVLIEQSVLKQIDKACPQRLSEAVFADAVVLVEGETDKAVFDAVAERTGGVASLNVVVVDASGKDSLPLCRAILGALDIPSVMVADNDAHHRLDGGDSSSEAQQERAARAKRSNRRLMNSVGDQQEDWPSEGPHGDQLVFFDQTLERSLRSSWADWEAARTKLIEEDAGYEGKHALTYFNAVIEAKSEPPALLVGVFESLIRRLGEP